MLVNAGSGGFVTIPTDTVSNFTQLIVCFGAASGTVQDFWDDDNGTTRAYQFRLNASNGVDFIRFNTSVSAFTASTGALSSTQLVNGFVAIARSNGLSISVYASGVTSGSATMTGTPQPRNSTAQLYSRKGATIPFSGSIVITVDFDYALPDSAISSLLTNPWQLFGTPMPIYTKTSSGAAAYFSTIAFTSSNAPYVARAAALSRSASAGSSASALKALGRALSSTAGSAVANLKAAGRVVAATVGSAAQAVKFAGRSVSATAGSAVGYARSLVKSVGVSAGSAVANLKAAGRSITATADSAVNYVRSLATTIGATVGSAVQALFARPAVTSFMDMAQYIWPDLSQRRQPLDPCGVNPQFAAALRFLWCGSQRAPTLAQSSSTGLTVTNVIGLRAPGALGLGVAYRPSGTFKFTNGLGDGIGFFESAAGGDYTFQCVISGITLSGAKPGFWRSTANYNGNDACMTGASYSTLLLLMNGTAVFAGGVSDPPVPASGNLNLIVSVKSGSRATAWINGVRYSVTTTATTGNMVGSGNAVRALGFQTANTNTVGGIWNSAAFWNRALTDAECAALSDNPWQVFAISATVLGAVSPFNMYFQSALATAGSAANYVRGVATSLLTSSGSSASAFKGFVKTLVTTAGFVVSSATRRMYMRLLSFAATGSETLSRSVTKPALTVSGNAVSALKLGYRTALATSGSAVQSAKRVALARLSSAGSAVSSALIRAKILLVVAGSNVNAFKWLTKTLAVTAGSVFVKTYNAIVTTARSLFIGNRIEDVGAAPQPTAVSPQISQEQIPAVGSEIVPAINSKEIVQ